ncbi:hypothetical protein NQ315_014629, partial [Exocentrus adspersus]
MASESESSVSSDENDEIDWLGPLGAEEDDCGLYEDLVDIVNNNEVPEEKTPAPVVFVDIDENSVNLAPAAERLLKKFQPVKSYFLSMASPPAILQKFFQDEFAEAYLGFLVNVGSTMQITIRKLQSDKVLILELHETMMLLRRSLQTKLDQEFYGAIARNIIVRSDDNDKIVQFKRQANAFLERTEERTISYLEK